MSKAVKSVRYVFTWNNYTQENIDFLKGLAATDNIDYMIFGKEVAPTTGTEHLQGYIHFHSKRSKSAIVKKLKGAHVEIAKGDDFQNQDYCSKNDEHWEFGEPVKQGTRSDLDALKESILNNGLTVDEIVIQNPWYYQNYGRTLNKIEDLAMRKKFRTWMTVGEWIWGPTGVGKSKYAYEGFNPDTHYNWKDDLGWQDGYCGQETVIINDFRGHIKYEDLLKIMDMHPFEVRRRAREPMPFLAKKIIITSSLPPEKVYRHRDEEDSLTQLYRRCTVRYFSADGEKNGPEVVLGNNRPGLPVRDESDRDDIYDM